MKRAIGSLNAKLDGFDASCFDGVYVTGDIDTEAISRMNGNRPRVEETEEDSRASEIKIHSFRKPERLADSVSGRKRQDSSCQQRRSQKAN